MRSPGWSAPLCGPLSMSKRDCPPCAPEHRVASQRCCVRNQNRLHNRDGNVTSEARAFPGVSGDPGTGTQSFSYDALDRVTASNGLASGSRRYAYDRDGNRVTRTEGGTTFSSTYDRTDQLVSVTKGILPVQSFSYDPYGNLTTDAETGTASGVTAMTYDLADRLTGIDPAGTADDTAFTLDALGRFATRTVGGRPTPIAMSGRPRRSPASSAGGPIPTRSSAQRATGSGSGSGAR